MSDSIFKVNGKLDIYYGEELYKSIVQDIIEEGLVISVPIKEGMYITPTVGDSIEALYYEQLEVYKFKSKVLGRRTENHMPQILLENPKNVKRIQRRQYVRVPQVNLVQYVKVEVGMTEVEIDLMLSGMNLKKGILLDLSGGGIKLKSYEPLNSGEKIATFIQYENEKIKVKGQVVRVVKDPDGKSVCGVTFIDMDNNTREKIVKMIFAMMRKQRKTI